jgi:predicted Zn-dependent protease
MAAVAERQMPYEFTLVASDVPNAFALPGGKIFVTAGLMQRLNNERQLAGVLGHEIGHVTDRHNVQGLQRQMGADVFAQVVAKAVGGQSADMAKAGAQIAGSMVTLKYGRQDEYTADQLGVRYLAKAGYNPWGMVEVLEVLQSLSKTEPGKLAEMFQTHPLTSKRVAEAVAIVQRDQPRAKLAEGDPNAARFMEMRNLLAQTLGH